MSRPGRFNPRKDPVSSYRRLGGPQSRSGRVWKISPPPGFDSPDRSARSETLHRLRYPGPIQHTTLPKGYHPSFYPVRAESVRDGFPRTGRRA